MQRVYNQHWRITACREGHRCKLGIKVDLYSIAGLLRRGSIANSNPFAEGMNSVEVIPVDSPSDKTRFFIPKPLIILPGHLELSLMDFQGGLSWPLTSKECLKFVILRQG